jgi:hypothetical protein
MRVLRATVPSMIGWIVFCCTLASICNTGGVRGEAQHPGALW